MKESIVAENWLIYIVEEMETHSCTFRTCELKSQYEIIKQWKNTHFSATLLMTQNVANPILQ